MAKLCAFLEAHQNVIQVRLADLKGSSPREVGASIFVSETGLFGTIGGGQLEYIAIDEARRMLKREELEREMTVPLGPEIGQCCGGVVKLVFNCLDDLARENTLLREERQIQALPHVYIFGAGHVGRALAASLSLLPLRPILVDSRASELALTDIDIEMRCSPLPEADVRTAPAGSAFVILTHDHALDFLLAREALLRGDAHYVGMIGSKTKRGKFKNWLRQDLGEDATILLEDFICPIGAGGANDKRPSVIAAMVAAEIVMVLEARAEIDTMAAHISVEPEAD